MEISLRDDCCLSLIIYSDDNKVVDSISVTPAELDLFIFGVGEKLGLLSRGEYSFKSRFPSYPKEEYRFPLYWDIVSCGLDKWSIREYYYYKGDSLDYIGPGGISSSTYGEFTMWDLLNSFDEILKVYYKNSPVEIV